MRPTERGRGLRSVILDYLEHVPPELNRQDSTALWIGDSTGIDLPFGGGRCRLPILLIFEVG